LPIAGGKGKSKNSQEHQAPTLLSPSDTTHLDYRSVIRQSLALLVPGTGWAVCTSADKNSLKYAILEYNSYWRVFLQQQVLLGGLAGHFMCMQRKPSSTKDISMWLPVTMKSNDDSCDFSQQVGAVAMDVCSKYWIDRNTWQLHELIAEEGQSRCTNGSILVLSVHLKDVYVVGTATSAAPTLTSHCYRITFDSIISTHQSKILERSIRSAITQSSFFEKFQLR
jgi:hypothetical protein